MMKKSPIHERAILFRDVLKKDLSPSFRDEMFKALSNTPEAEREEKAKAIRAMVLSYSEQELIPMLKEMEK